MLSNQNISDSDYPIIKWQRVFDSFSEAVWLLDNDHRIVNSNKSGVEFFNLHLSDIKGKYCWEVLHGTNAPLPNCPIEKMKKSLQRETLIFQKNDEWLEVIVDPIIDKDNNHVGTIHIVKNITENIQSKKNEHLNNQLISSATDMMAIVDKEFKYLLVNKSYAAEFNKEPHQLIGCSVLELFDKENFINSIKPNALKCMNGESINFQHWTSLPNLGKVFLDVNYFPYYDENNVIDGFTVCSRDITKLKQSELNLIESENKLKTITIHSPVGMFLDDAAGKATYINNKCAELIGVPIEKALNLDWVPYIHPEDRERVTSEWAQAVTEGRVFCQDYRWVHDDGKVVWTHGEVHPVKNNNRELILYIGTLVDVSELKKSQQELLIYQENLEDLVNKRTIELERSNIKLNDANKELEAFSYSVSHDLRAPLRGIDGWSAALSEDYGQGLDQTAQDYINRVRSETQHMGKLIEGLLSLARLSKVKLNFSEANLSNIANNISKRLQKEDTERSVDFQIQNGVSAVCDPTLIEIVLTNLFENAWKFTSTRNHTIIKFGAYTEENSTIYFVSDNGVGFNMEYSKKLFETFQRLHKNTEFPGSGIGLATVKRIIQRHKGKIYAESEVNKGSKFSFSLKEL